VSKRILCMICVQSLSSEKRLDSLCFVNIIPAEAG
jgi:hypothetical protein